MASQPDTGSRLWRGLRSLMFGEDSEPTLRHQIEEAIDEAEDEQPKKGDLSPLERQMLKNLLHFGDRTAGDICVTRGEILSAPRTSTMEELAKLFAEAGHSRLPLTGDSLDEIVGMVHIKDVFNAYFDATERKSVDEIVRTPLFVPESMGVLDLLARSRRSLGTSRTSMTRNSSRCSSASTRGCGRRMRGSSSTIWRRPWTLA